MRGPTPCPLGQGGWNLYAKLQYMLREKSACRARGVCTVKHTARCRLLLLISRTAVPQMRRQINGAAVYILFQAGATRSSVLKGLKAPPAGLKPAIFGLEVRRLVH